MGKHIAKSSSLTIFWQDNKSAMLFAENGNQSSSQCTRHLNVTYYFITDKITKGEIQINHCDSSHIIVDYFTKPLQNSIFDKFWDLMLNVSAGSKPTDPKECVGP